MSKFEWMYGKDYASKNGLNEQLLVNMARKKEIKLCAIMDETNFPGGRAGIALLGFDFEGEGSFQFDYDETTLNPKLPEEEEWVDYSDDLVVYAYRDDRWFLKLDAFSLLELVEKGSCTIPTIHRSRYDDLKFQNDTRICSIEVNFHNIAVIIKDELSVDERFPSRERNTLLKIIGGLAVLAGDKINLNVAKPLSNKIPLGYAHTISEKLEHLDPELKVSPQTVEKKVSEALSHINFISIIK